MQAAETFFVLDFDRCLGNETLYELFAKVVAELSPLLSEQLRHAQQQIEQEGGSFDMFSWLRLRSDDGFMEQLSKNYITQADQRGNGTFLAQGASELLEFLDSKTVPYMVMTYGGAEYQKLKLRAAGLQSVPVRIVATKKKAHYITEWWDERSQQFVIPERDLFPAKTVVLVDDKPAAFEGLPPRALGYLVAADSKRLPSQVGKILDHVVVCRDLRAVLKAVRLVVGDE